MVRTLPRVSRRSSVAVALGSLLLSLAAMPVASADDLHHRKHRVEGSISKAAEHLDESSGKLVEATQALDAAKAKLDGARQHLAETRGELAAAVALDHRMQSALEQAVQRLSDAREDLAKGQANLAEQEDVLGQIAVQNYQQGDPNLLGLSMVLNSQDPNKLTSQLGSVQNVLDKESVTLDRLQATKILLAAKEKEVTDAKQQVARKREAAASNLERKKSLESEAEQQEAAVSDLVGARAEAQSAASAAQRADLAMLRGLQRERERISALFAARADAATARADALANLGPTHPSNGFLDFPVDGPITSPYGMRLHPIYHKWRLHDGTDFGVACGTPIRAAASGKVIEQYFNSAYGNRVIIDHGYHDGVHLGTAYNHMEAYATHVGERVKRGDVVGFVGSTGYSTGCHLHFMVFENGAIVDPMSWL